MTIDVDTHVARIAQDGYTIVENAIEPDLVDALHEHLLQLEQFFAVEPSPNSFEGHATIRIYNLLAFGALYERIPVHPNVLPVVEGVLDAGCLVSSLSSIAILPGETAQPIHADDQLIPLDKPHRPTVCNSMWALTDFTEANGATTIRTTASTTTRSRPRCRRARCWCGTAACGTAAARTPPTNGGSGSR